MRQRDLLHPSFLSHLQVPSQPLPTAVQALALTGWIALLFTGLRSQRNSFNHWREENDQPLAWDGRWWELWSRKWCANIQTEETPQKSAKRWWQSIPNLCKMWLRETWSGQDTISLKQLQYQLDNVKRSSTPKMRKRKDDDTDEISPEQRAAMQDTYRCVKWDVKCMPRRETPESQHEKKEKMKECLEKLTQTQKRSKISWSWLTIHSDNMST